MAQAKSNSFDIVVTQVVATVEMDLYGEFAPIVVAFKAIGGHVGDNVEMKGGDFNYRFTCFGQDFEVNVSAGELTPPE